MNYLIFGDVNTADYGIGISGLKTHGSPARAGSYFSVPGLNGDLFVPNGRFENISITYDAFIANDQWQNQWDSFKAALYAKADSYRRLEDTYHPEYFRKAMLIDSIDPDVCTLNLNGSFSLVFNCKPERWLKSGESSVSYSSAGTITNPTNYNAKPIIRVYGYGTVTVGTSTIIVTEAGTEYIDIDTQIEDAYEGSTNQNSKISAESSFGVLIPGENAVSFDSTVTKLEIIPRWWTV